MQLHAHLINGLDYLISTGKILQNFHLLWLCFKRCKRYYATEALVLIIA
jgi:hypothetical protein